MASPFHTTSWSLISCTRESGEAARQATAALCQQYWRPLYVYARQSGQSAHAAEDTIQNFFIHVIENEVFARADADRGRFRTFLLRALRRFLARQNRDQSRLKRTPGSKLLSLEIEGVERAILDSADVSPDRAFDREWALVQLNLTWSRLEEEHREGGTADLFRRLRPIIAGAASTPIREIASELSMSEGAVNVAAHRLRRQFGEALRKQLAQTLMSPDEVDDEIGRLRAALAGTA